MNFGPGSIHQQPAQRAAIDEARLRARKERSSRTPGPGTYDAKRAEDGTNTTRPSSAFKSRTQRTSDPTAKDVGDPGAYNPSNGADLAMTAAKSFNKSQQGGVGGFGTTSKRADLSAISDAPGPGQYDSKQPEKPEAKQSSAFASQSKRGKSQAEVTPGVGAYNTENTTLARVQGGDSAFKSKDGRFKQEMKPELAHVGPGTYQQENQTISRASAVNVGKVSSAFASTTLRDGFLG